MNRIGHTSTLNFTLQKFFVLEEARKRGLLLDFQEQELSVSLYNRIVDMLVANFPDEFCVPEDNMSHDFCGN